MITVAAGVGYELTEYEASSFIPYLAAKLGDKIESVRQSSHDIFRAICKIYPASKVFAYLLEVEPAAIVGTRPPFRRASSQRTRSSDRSV